MVERARLLLVFVLTHVVVVVLATDGEDHVAVTVSNYMAQAVPGCNGISEAWGFRGRCYTVHTDDLMWKEARSMCIANGGNLVESVNLPSRIFVNALQIYNNNITSWIGFKEEDERRHSVRAVTGETLGEGKKQAFIDKPPEALSCLLSTPSLSKPHAENVVGGAPCDELHPFICSQHDFGDKVTLRRTYHRNQEKHHKMEEFKKRNVLGSIQEFNRMEGVTGLVDGDVKYRPREADAHNRDACPLGAEFKEEEGDSSSEHPSRKKRNAVIESDYLWTNSTIPFMFTSDYEFELRERVLTQIGLIMAETCLSFREVTEQQAGSVVAYILIGDFGGCWSYVGMYRGAQELSLSAYCTEDGGRIQHEFLHALGFYHEHSRPNRDDFLQVVFSEISEEYQSQVIKRRSNDLDVGYDYESVMHYASNSVSKSPDIDSLVPVRHRHAIIGNRDVMTPSDYAKVNLLYGCLGVPINGEWSLWSDWTSCSALCGTGVRSRERRCVNPPPANNGRDCEGPASETEECNTQSCNELSVAVGCWLDDDDADSLTSLEGTTYILLDDYDERPNPITACETAAAEAGYQIFAVKDSGKCLVQLAADIPLLYQAEGASDDCEDGEGFAEGMSVYRFSPDDPVNGQWTAWTVHTLCTVTCDGGTHTRTHTCMNPAPSNGGRDCDGSHTETTPCNENPCPVHGGWSDWTEWSECNSECISRRSRSCTNPEPAHEGDLCQGHYNEYYMCCDTNKVDGGWSDWVGPTTCTKTCGGGTQTYIRTCTNPAPSGGGTDCQGNSTSVEACNTETCVVNGGWSSYTEFSECTVSCDGGTQYRTRLCNNPPPSLDGGDCIGSGVETVPCNVEACPVNGGWSDWSPYSECSVTCGTGTQMRSRLCNKPEPSENGDECQGSSTEDNTCATEPCPVDGAWTDWDSGECSVSCGLGSQTQTRSCTNPAPAFNGRECNGTESQVLPCQPQDCPLPGVPLPEIFLPFDEENGGVVRGFPLDLVVEGAAEIVHTGGRVDGFLRFSQPGGLHTSLADHELGQCLSSADFCQNGFTVSLWFRQSGEQRRASKRFRPSTLFSTGVESEEATTPADGLGLALFVRRNGDLKATVATSLAKYTVDLPSFLFENTTTWHPIALTYHKDEGLTLYHKGVAQSRDEHGRVNEGSTNITKLLYFGRPAQCDDHYIFGSLDHFKAWGTKLSPEQVYADYMSVPARCSDCNSRAACNATAMTCTCFDGFEGDGRTCQMVGSGGSGVSVPDPPYCWPFNKVVDGQGVFDADTPVFRDGDMLLMVGVVDHAVSLNGRRVWLNGGDFSGQCLSYPDACNSGLVVSFWINYYGSYQVNFLFSSGSQETAENTGVACWVEEDELTCTLQTMATYYELTATIKRGVWFMLSVAWSPEGGLLLFFDGKLFATDPSGRSHVVTKELPSALTIGRPNDLFSNNGRFLIDNLAIWQEILTPMQIDSVYHNGLLCQSNSRR